jgi:RNA-directed DNA polymerase
LLANIYLNTLDHEMPGQGKEMVRYADDFVILCESEAEAQEVMEQLRQWVAGVGLLLHPTKTRIVDATQKGGFDFLGYHFERGHRWPRQKSLDKFKATIREKTGRCSSESMETIIKDVNRSLSGWFEYFRHSVANIFDTTDKWVRQRLRSILRKRHKLQGRSRGRSAISMFGSFAFSSSKRSRARAKRSGSAIGPMHISGES